MLCFEKEQGETIMINKEYECPFCGRVAVPIMISYNLKDKVENHISCGGKGCKHTLIFATNYWPRNEDWLENLDKWSKKL